VVALGVVASPRAGNTAVAVADLLEGTGDAGKTIVLGRDAVVGPIGDCGACIAAGACDRDDDFDAVMEEICAADLLVLGTPLYWYGPAAQLKALLDRWSCLLDREEDRFRARMRGKRTALVVAQGERGFYEAGPCLQMLDWTLRYLEMPTAARVVVLGHGRDDLRSDAAQRARVRAVGRTLAAHPAAPDLLPPWFHLGYRPGQALGGAFPPPT
jgi:multimeric flavodoxin WrbA